MTPTPRSIKSCVTDTNLALSQTQDILHIPQAIAGSTTKRCDVYLRMNDELVEGEVCNLGTTKQQIYKLYLHFMNEIREQNTPP